jgi:hypothetical protein
MPTIWAYNLSNEKLMHALWEATVRAGISGSGLVIDLSGSDYGTTASYLYGVTLSRLDGKTPPLKPGDKVRMDPKETYRCGSAIIVGGRYQSGAVDKDTEYEVSRVSYVNIFRYPYEGGNKYSWVISFTDEKLNKCQFPAERFVKVEQMQPTEA